MQPDLFEMLQHDPLDAANAPLLDMWLEVMAQANKCLQKCPFSRDQVVDRINLCLRDGQRKVTLIQLNKWLSPSQQNAMPAWVLPAFCWAVQSDAVFIALLQAIGRKMVDVRGDMMRQVTESNIEVALKQKAARQLEEQMLAVIAQGGMTIGR